jgi:hypothetical protein
MIQAAALRPSLVILSMLSIAGIDLCRFSFSARAASDATNIFSAGVAGARTMRGLPPSSSGTGSLSMSAV